jgi:hypothetical protein
LCECFGCYCSDWAAGRIKSEPDGPSVEKRAYVSLYTAEQIINWRVERVNGRNIPTLIVLSENLPSETPEDEFEFKAQQQVRVLKLVAGDSINA